MNIKFSIDAVKFCRDNRIHREYINIALGAFKMPNNMKEVRNYLTIKRNGKKST